MNDDRLDALLAAYRVAEPSAALRARIIEAAPRQRALGRAWRWITGTGLGMVLAASCAAGVAAGFTLAPASLTSLVSGQSLAQTDASSSLADPADDPGSG
jgi:hypothetical protein